jgi:hypothetical protein
VFVLQHWDHETLNLVGYTLPLHLAKPLYMC